MTEIFVPLRKLSADNNPRSSVGDTTELQDSIASVGLITPLSVFETDKEGWYEVASGGRRLTALRALHLARRKVPNLEYTKIPCILIKRPEEEGGLAIMVAANSQKRLPPSDEGKALKTLMVSKRWTLVKVAKATGTTPVKARLLLMLADAAPAIQRKVDKGEMSLSAFGRLANASKKVIDEIAETEGRVTVRAVEKEIRKSQTKEEPLDGLAVNDEPDIVALLTAIKTGLQKIMSSSLLGPRERYIISDIKDILTASDGVTDKGKGRAES